MYTLTCKPRGCLLLQLGAPSPTHADRDNLPVINDYTSQDISSESSRQAAIVSSLPNNKVDTFMLMLNLE